MSFQLPRRQFTETRALQSAARVGVGKCGTAAHAVKTGDGAVAAVGDAQNTLTQTQQSTANDIASSQQAFAKLKANYSSASTSFANLSTSVKPDVQSYTSAIDGARIQLQQAINDMSSRQTSDVQSARNSDGRRPTGR